MVDKFLEISGDLGATEKLPDIDLNATTTEGAERLVMHLVCERSRSIIETKRASVLKTTGRLCCEACGFDFAATYGILGNEFCEVHHLAPLSESIENKQTTLDDLAILCSNCHRMIHRSRPMLSVQELRDLIHKSE